MISFIFIHVFTWSLTAKAQGAFYFTCVSNLLQMSRIKILNKLCHNERTAFKLHAPSQFARNIATLKSQLNHYHDYLQFTGLYEYFTVKVVRAISGAIKGLSAIVH